MSFIAERFCEFVDEFREYEKMNIVNSRERFYKSFQNPDWTCMEFSASLNKKHSDYRYVTISRSRNDDEMYEDDNPHDNLFVIDFDEDTATAISQFADDNGFEMDRTEGNYLLKDSDGNEVRLAAGGIVVPINKEYAKLVEDDLDRFCDLGMKHPLLSKTSLLSLAHLMNIAYVPYM